MKLARLSQHPAYLWALVILAFLALSPLVGSAHETGASHVHFQKPERAAGATAPGAGLKFRPANAIKSPATGQATTSATIETEPRLQPAAHQQVAKPLSAAPRPAQAQVVRQAPARTAVRPTFAQPARGAAQLADYRVDDRSNRRVSTLDSVDEWMEQPHLGHAPQAEYLDSCMTCDEPACGIAEPACGIAEPACGILEPACGIQPSCGYEPDCGLIEPGCGVVEPGCGCGEISCDGVDCGSVVGRPGPDYWCFPVCLPRFKELSVWGGVHGFKGPRDAPEFGGVGDGNFGFQEGVNLGGRAPFVGLLFPQLSYQLGYQAVQSQLSGNSGGATEDRSQNFVTAGLFRRVPAGLQFGAVWDFMQDDFVAEEDFHQLRYEISIKSRRGREIGFWGATHTNSKVVDSTEFQAVDQYNLFVRCHFREAGEIRFWGGATNDGEGIFGSDVYAPLSSRWSLQTGFNYLIPSEDPGIEGAREESWNIFTNLVWHYGKTAKASRTNPHRPLFMTADNGYMFIDARP